MPQFGHPERLHRASATSNIAAGVVEALVETGVSAATRENAVSGVHQVLQQVALQGPALDINEVEQAGRDKTVVHDGEDQPIGHGQGELRQQPIGTGARHGEHSQEIVGLGEREYPAGHGVVHQAEDGVGVERRDVFLGIPSGFVSGVAITNANHIACLQRVVGPVEHHGVLDGQRQVRIERLGNEERLTQGLSDGG